MRETVKSFRDGDRVTWSSHANTATGQVIKKITSDGEAAGRPVRASPRAPQYLVRSDNGGDAVHTPEALDSADWQ